MTYKPQPTPGPYEVMQLSDDALLIRRRWDSLVTPEATRTFGSAYGAHIAIIRFVMGGTPSPEQARANAGLLARAPVLLRLLQEADHFINSLAVMADRKLNYVEASLNMEYLDDLCDRIAAATSEYSEWIPEIENEN